MVNNSETCSAVKHYSKPLQQSKEILTVPLLAPSDAMGKQSTHCKGERGLGVKVPAADKTEHYGNAPKVLPLNLNVPLKSVTS